MRQGKEVPHKHAEEFMKGVEDDPKFVRFQQRLAALSRLGDLRTEVLALKMPPERVLVVALLAASLAALVAVLLPWQWARQVELVVLVIAAGLEEYRKWRERLARARRVVEAEVEIDQLTVLIASIDQETEKSIKIIDPDTFGAPRPQKAQEQRSS